MVSMQCHNLHSFKEGMIVLCQNILKTNTNITFSLTLFTIPLMIYVI